MASATILGQVGVGKTACNFALSGFSQGSQLAGNSTFASPARLANYSAVSIPPSHGGPGFLRKKLEVSARCEAISTKARVSEATQKKEIKPVVVIDNYDSFTYNLCQYLGDLGCKIEVYRNDEITVEELRTKNLRGILISPGPGNPQDSGISLEIVRKLGPTIPLFGVCMGLQCMGEAFGGKIVRAPNGVMHGKTSPVFYEENGEPGLLDGLPNPFTACRYHSLVIEENTFPTDQLEVTAWTEDGLVMGVRHRVHKHIQGVQFHPESIRTQNGMQIVGNFIKMLERMEAAEMENASAEDVSVSDM